MLVQLLMLAETASSKRNFACRCISALQLYNGIGAGRAYVCGQSQSAFWMVAKIVLKSG